MLSSAAKPKSIEMEVLVQRRDGTRYVIRQAWHSNPLKQLRSKLWQWFSRIPGIRA